MKINRILSHFFTTEISNKEVTKKYGKSFEAVLQEEQEKLMRLMSEAEETENIKQFYNTYNPRMKDYPFIEE